MAVAMAALALAVPSVHRECHKTFTVDMATRAIAATFSGTKDVSTAERRRLDRYIRCQRNRGARPYVRTVRKRARRAWVTRRSYAPPPLSGLALCIINAETGGLEPGGDPNWFDGTYSGIASWDYDAWHAYGAGGRFSAMAYQTSRANQEWVLMYQLANGGAHMWTPFDPC